MIKSLTLFFQCTQVGVGGGWLVFYTGKGRFKEKRLGTTALVDLCSTIHRCLNFRTLISLSLYGGRQFSNQRNSYDGIKSASRMNNGDFIFLDSIDKVSTVVEPVTDQSHTDSINRDTVEEEGDMSVDENSMKRNSVLWEI